MHILSASKCSIINVSNDSLSCNITTVDATLKSPKTAESAVATATGQYIPSLYDSVSRFI